MKIIGDINLEGDKSISHRALILASICKGESIIKNLPSSKDVISTISCLKKTGININIHNSHINIHGGSFSIPEEDLDCSNSGTSIRLLAGLYSSIQLPVTLYGDSSLCKRPMDRIIEPLSQMGVSIKSNNNKAPIKLIKFRPKSITYEIPVPSAQVKSCLILASLGISDKSTFKQRISTRNHLELMIDSISKNVIEYNNNKISINGKGKNFLRPFNINIPGDISSASYLIGLAVLLKNSKLIINNLLLNPYRMGFINTLILMGANIKIDNVQTIKNEKVGRLIARGSPQLRPCSVAKEIVPNMIDEIPLLSLICSHIKGRSFIGGLEELKYKESDRLVGIYNILSKMGVNINYRKNNSIEINGENRLYNTNKLDNFRDHRLAMMISCAQILSGNKISFDDCIDTSFPKFKKLINKILIK